MLPPHPLPVVPQGAPDEAPEAAAFFPAPGCPGCFLALFCFCWGFWSCGLLLRSNVCAQPFVARNREQKSARHKKFFFTGPPLSVLQREHVDQDFHDAIWI